MLSRVGSRKFWRQEPAPTRRKRKGSLDARQRRSVDNGGSGKTPHRPGKKQLRRDVPTNKPHLEPPARPVGISLNG